MIPFDVVYRRPDSVEEAVAAWRLLPETSLWYAGGTEIVTGARGGTYQAEALIDIKGLPECRETGLRREAGRDLLYFGAGLSLNEIVEVGHWPLLAKAARRVADHTTRNRLTLGGNVAGRLPWREALLPFLAAGGSAWLAAPSAAGGVERRQVPLAELHAKRLVFRPGEFLLGLSVPAEVADFPSYCERVTSGPEVDYPIIALCALASPGGRRFALSGYQDYPVLVETDSPSVASFPAARSDLRASGEYRAALLEGSLARAMEALR